LCSPALWLPLAQEPTPAPPPQGQAPAGQPPTEQGRGDSGRGAGPGGGRQGRGGRAGGFTQFTRELAPQDVIVRGKSLYEANCASCHASDLRGSQTGANLLRSGIALGDQHGDKIGASLKTHSPAITLADTDSVAIAEYIHSVHATMSGQGSPPGRNPTGIELNVLVGDAKAGATYFAAAWCTTSPRICGRSSRGARRTRLERSPGGKSWMAEVWGCSQRPVACCFWATARTSKHGTP
jgi:mono/diheme cytochrome c family protein